GDGPQDRIRPSSPHLPAPAPAGHPFSLAIPPAPWRKALTRCLHCIRALEWLSTKLYGRTAGVLSKKVKRFARLLLNLAQANRVVEMTWLLLRSRPHEHSNRHRQWPRGYHDLALLH